MICSCPVNRHLTVVLHSLIQIYIQLKICLHFQNVHKYFSPMHRDEKENTISLHRYYGYKILHGRG